MLSSLGLMSRMNKLLIISGPTATGKTALAIKMAQEFNGEIISADSRQIYKGMDIGTGKDHPQDIKIHLIDLITPDQKFSVADYQKLALQKIKEIQLKNKLPIIVGGTGFYIDSIINQSYDTFSVKPKKILRYFLNKLPISVLQKIYCFLNKNSYLKLNNSDKNNPYRLIRKIEISILSNKKVSPLLSKGGLGGDFDYLHLSLTAPNKYLYQKIDSRVEKRITEGVLTEIKNLLKKYQWTDPGLNTLAYKEFKPYFKNKNQQTVDEFIKKWKFNEHAYARRQKTWFKKRINTKFIDVTKPKFNEITQSLVKKWYNKL